MASRCPGALFDFGLFFFHNAKELLARGTAPYFYLPKIESHLEARLWNDVFVHAQAKLGMPKGTIRATVLIETITGRLRDGRDPLRSCATIRPGSTAAAGTTSSASSRNSPKTRLACMPDRAQVTMTSHFLRSYSLLLIKTCHRREIHAMGGMAAQIPIRDDPAANEAAMEKVRADKQREAGDGHDGTWVAHPGLVAIAKEIFDREMHASQPDRPQAPGRRMSAASDLLAVPRGTITEAGLRQNLNVGIGYIEAWLRGTGCVPLYQSDGGRRHRRDQPRAGLAVDPPRRPARRRPHGRCRTLPCGRRAAKLRQAAGDEAAYGSRYDDAAQLFR